MSDNDNITFTVTCTMKENQVRKFIRMLATMEWLGKIGSSRKLEFFADGDGAFRPTFKINGEVLNDITQYIQDEDTFRF